MLRNGAVHPRAGHQEPIAHKGASADEEVRPRRAISSEWCRASPRLRVSKRLPDGRAQSACAGSSTASDRNNAGFVVGAAARAHPGGALSATCAPLRFRWEQISQLGEEVAELLYQEPDSACCASSCEEADEDAAAW